jgi:RNase P/RNase MRP subunit p29
MALDWFGDKVTQKMTRAQVRGVNKTMSECVIHAKRNHEFENRTATLEGGIRMVQPARKNAGGGVSGRWGVADVVYALIQEKGGTIVPKNANALKFRAEDGSFVTVASVTIPARPYLRPAADARYPGLAGNIRQAYEGGVA